jgi:excisionase family DNA binding protein
MPEPTTRQTTGNRDLLVTFREAMSFLRVSRSTLYRLMWSGKLPGYKVGATWRFYERDLLAMVGDASLSGKDGDESDGSDR